MLLIWKYSIDKAREKNVIVSNTLYLLAVCYVPFNTMSVKDMGKYNLKNNVLRGREFYNVNSGDPSRYRQLL